MMTEVSRGVWSSRLFRVQPRLRLLESLLCLAAAACLTQAAAPPAAVDLGMVGGVPSGRLSVEKSREGGGVSLLAVLDIGEPSTNGIVPDRRRGIALRPERALRPSTGKWLNHRGCHLR